MNTATNTMSFFIDTLQFSKRLQEAGMQRRIADELAEALKENQDKSLDSLATKFDIEKLDVRMSKVESKIESLEHKLTLKMFFMLSAAVAAITWLDKAIN